MSSFHSVLTLADILGRIGLVSYTKMTLASGLEEKLAWH